MSRSRKLSRRGRLLFAARQPQAIQIAAQRGQCHVVYDGHGHDQPQLAAVFGDVGDAQLHGLFRRTNLHRRALEGDLAACRPARCRRPPAPRRCARSRSARQNRAPRLCALRRRHPEKTPSLPRPCTDISSVADGGVRLGEEIAHLAAHHFADHQLAGRLPARPRGNPFAVAQHGDAVARCGRPPPGGGR